MIIAQVMMYTTSMWPLQLCNKPSKTDTTITTKGGCRLYFYTNAHITQLF